MRSASSIGAITKRLSIIIRIVIYWSMNYYRQENFLMTPVGNNIISFWERKEKWSDVVLRVPPLVEGTIDDIQLLETWVCYEYVSDKNILISSFGLESLVHIIQWDKDIFIIDNHNHAFSCRWRSYINKKIDRWSHLIHIDQHSDYADPIHYLSDSWDQNIQDISLLQIDNYTNEVLTIASFIKPALACGLCVSHDMILSEYALLDYDIWSISSQSLIVDIDLDFWAPEMGIEYYYQTIKKVRQLIALPDVHCITIASSPTYIHQQRALQVLHDLLD